MSLQEILDAIHAWPPWVTYGALFLGAFIEYVFPPFPGDTLVVAGAVLVTVFGWDMGPVMALVTAGAVLGALGDYLVGRWLQRSGRIERLRPRWRHAIEGVAAQFSRRGAWYLALNRFVPGIRAFFFVAAGIAGLKPGPVLFWSALSAATWNALLLYLGFVLGDNLPAIERFLARYTTVVWVVIAVIITVSLWRLLRRRGDADGADAE